MPACYTLIVGTKNWSSWSLRAYMAMRATGAEFQEIIIPLRQPQTRFAIQKLTPSGKVPALQIEEGGAQFTVFDSLAICETLAERHPGAHLWPEEPAARARARSLSAVMHSGFAALRFALPMEFARRLPMPELDTEVRAEIAQITGLWADALADFEARGGFLFGTLTIADCMYAPVVSRFRTYGIALDPGLDAYCDRIFALPAMRDWLASAQREVAGDLC
jgi:glutathione S-transferase